MADAGPAPLPTEDARRFQALGEVAGELMHDLANVLAVLHGRATLALYDAQIGRIPAVDLEHVVEATGEMSRMLRDVMETLRGQELSPEVTFSPRQVVEQVIRHLVASSSTTGGIDVRLAADVNEELRLPGRASFLARVLQNLLSNALRHARSRIEVRLSTASGEAGNSLLLDVADDGPGLEGVSVDELFRPLAQGDRPGTVGLGLSSVRWAAEQLGGSIGCGTSDELGGTVFRIRLPL